MKENGNLLITKALQATSNSNLLPSVRLVLVVLAAHADENHQCDIMVPRIQQFTGLSRAAISRAFRTLQRVGLLKIYLHPEGRQRRLYKLSLKEGVI